MQDGDSEWVTLVKCVSVGGQRIPAYCIYAGKAHYDGWPHGSVDSDNCHSILQITVGAV
jgi:hypothetical protein